MVVVSVITHGGVVAITHGGVAITHGGGVGDHAWWCGGDHAWWCGNHAWWCQQSRIMVVWRSRMVQVVWKVGMKAAVMVVVIVTNS